MSGSEAVLDTNQAIAVLNAAGDAGTWVQQFQRICITVPVLGELLFGALRSQRATANLARVQEFVSRCEVLPSGPATAEAYARIRLDLKQRGTPIPENDLWIAAACREHGLPLATADAHFQWVDGLTVIQR